MFCCQKLKLSAETDQTIDVFFLQVLMNDLNVMKKKYKENQQTRKMNSLKEKEYDYFRRKKTHTHTQKKNNILH